MFGEVTERLYQIVIKTDCAIRRNRCFCIHMGDKKEDNYLDIFTDTCTWLASCGLAMHSGCDSIDRRNKPNKFINQENKD